MSHRQKEAGRLVKHPDSLWATSAVSSTCGQSFPSIIPESYLRGPNLPQRAPLPTETFDHLLVPEEDVSIREKTFCS